MDLASKNSVGTTSKWRRHIMRALFFLNFVGLAFNNWSTILFPQEQLSPIKGVGISFYAAFSLLCILGIRFPLKFIPLLLTQLIYKSAWIVGVYIPAKNSGLIDENFESWFMPMAVGIILDILVIPWKYVYVEYFRNLFRFRKINR